MQYLKRMQELYSLKLYNVKSEKRERNGMSSMLSTISIEEMRETGGIGANRESREVDTDERLSHRTRFMPWRSSSPPGGGLLVRSCICSRKLAKKRLGL